MEPKEIDTDELKVTAIIFILMVMCIIIFQHLQHDKLKSKQIDDLNTQLLQVNLQLVQSNEHYMIAVENLNSMNNYASELEDRLIKLDKLDKVYKEIGRIYSK